MKVPFAIALTLLLVSSTSVSELDNFTPLTCEGTIPKSFMDGISEYIEAEENNYEDTYQNDDQLEKLKEQFITASAISNNSFFNNGKVLFGDPITTYLNKIKDEVLKSEPQLKDKVHIYTLRSPNVNAFTTLNGNIYFELGLLARATSEAALAFAMSHEIAHYKEKHIIERVGNVKETQDLLKKRKKLTLDDILSLHMKREQNQEYEADSIGFGLFEKTNFEQKEAVTMLASLATAHVALGDKKFDKKLFNSGYFQIPLCFFKDNLKEIEYHENKDDKYNSHPDIAKRKDKLNKLIGKRTAEGKRFIAVESEFKKMKLLAAFEVMQRLIISRQYAEAIFTGYNLLDQYPENQYLQQCLAKALYAAAIYKNNQSFHYTAASYSNVDGEAQQVFYLLKNLSAVQLNTMALKNIYNLRKKYPDNKSLDLMETDLIRNLVIKNNVDLSNFLDKSQAENEWKSRYERGLSDTSADKISLRQNYKNFYLLALSEAKEDAGIKEKFEKAKERKRLLDIEKNMPYKEAQKKRDAEEKEKEKNGYKIKADSILVLEPSYIRFRKDLKTTLQATENDNKLLLEGLKQNSKNYKADFSFLAGLNQNETGQYNKYTAVASWVQERNSHLDQLYLVPLAPEMFTSNKELSKYKYICTIDIARFNNKQLYYLFNLYHIQSGKKSYRHVMVEKENPSINTLLKYISKDFENITK